MSAPNSPSPNTINGSTICAHQSDSPLSTTSSILGILTFGLALLGYYLALFSATRSAPSEIQRLVSDLRSTQAEINRVAEWIFYDEGGFNRPELLQPPRHQQYKLNTPEYKKAVAQSRNQVLYAEVEALLSMCVRLFYEADDLLKKSRREGKGWWRRVQYLVNRDEVLDKVARLQEHKAKLANIQMSLFLRKSAAHDAMLKRVVKFIDEYEARGLRGDFGTVNSSEQTDFSDRFARRPNY